MTKHNTLKRRFTPAQRAELSQRRLDGETLRSLALEFGVSHIAILKASKLAGMAALSITFQNDGTGPAEAANYTVRVMVNRSLIVKARVVGHRRSEDWRALVVRLLDQLSGT